MNQTIRQNKTIDTTKIRIHFLANTTDKIDLRDLESALKIILTSEIEMHSQINNEMMFALKHFLRVLLKVN
jgi:hypothetical protein